MSRELNNSLTISKKLHELMDHSISWVIRKVENEEGFSAIMLSNHPEGMKVSIYQLDSVEESLEKSEQDLREELNDAKAYAIAYDAWYVKGEERIPVILCCVEELGMKSQHQFALFYEIENKQKRKVIKPISDLLYIGRTDKIVLHAI